MKKFPYFLVCSLVCALVLFFTPSIHAADFTWNQTAAGTFTWTTGANWTSGTAPNPGAAGDVDTVRTDLTANQTVTLNNAVITLGTLNLGDALPTSGTTNQFTVSTGTLIFQGVSGGPTALNISNVGSGSTPNHTISSAVSLQGGSPLTITATGAQGVTISGAVATNGNTLNVTTSGIGGVNGTGGNDSTGKVGITGVISGSGAIVKTGMGVLVLSGSNTSTGSLEIRSGAVDVVGGNGYLNATAITIYGGASGVAPPNDSNVGNPSGGTFLRLGAFAAPANRLNDAAVVTLKGGGLYYARVNGTWAESFNSLKFSEGTSYLTTNDPGTMTITGTMSREAGATAVIRRSGATNVVVVSGTIAGGLTGGGGVSGTSTISILPWAIGNENLNNGGNMEFMTYSGSLRPLTSSEYANNNLIAGATSNVQAGDFASLTVTSATINALKYTSGSINNLGAGKTLTIASGGLLYATNVNNGGISGAATLSFGAAEGIVHVGDNSTSGLSTFTISATVAGSGGLTKGGVGILVLSGSNTFAGTTTVAAGTMRIGNANALSVSNDVVLANTAAFALTQVSGSFSLSVTTLDLNNNNLTIGSLAGGGRAGGNVVLGSGTLTAGGSNVSTVYAGSIGGSGGLVKVGTGTMTLGGLSSFSGGTRVNAGTLLVNNPGGSATGSGAVLVAASGSTNYGTLGGGAGAANGGVLNPLEGGASLATYAADTVGIMAGAVTVNQFAHLAPGNSIGTLTTGALTLDGGAVLDYEFNLAANDFISVNGLLALGGTIGINLLEEGSASPFATEGTYNLFSYDSLSGFSSSAFAVLNPTGGLDYTFINDTGNNLIQLNVAAVPEPSTVVLLGLGGLAVAFRGFARRRSKGWEKRAGGGT